MNLGGNRRWVPLINTANLKRLSKPDFYRTIKKRAPVLIFFRSYLAPRLKVKVHNLEVFQAQLCKNKNKKKRGTVDISSNLCGITGVVWNP